MSSKFIGALNSKRTRQTHKIWCLDAETRPMQRLEFFTNCRWRSRKVKNSKNDKNVSNNWAIHRCAGWHLRHDVWECPNERPPKPPTFWNSYTRTLILDTIMKLSGTIAVTQKTMTFDTHVCLVFFNYRRQILRNDEGHTKNDDHFSHVHSKM